MNRIPGDNEKIAFFHLVEGVVNEESSVALIDINAFIPVMNVVRQLVLGCFLSL